jgi:hypothetical protein
VGFWCPIWSKEGFEDVGVSPPSLANFPASSFPVIIVGAWIFYDRNVVSGGFDGCYDYCY